MTPLPGLITYPENLCASCAFLRETYNPDHDPGGGDPFSTFLSYCRAFPDGVPEDIRLRGYDHRRRYPGDNGVRYRPDRAKAGLLRAYEALVRPEDAGRDVSESARAWTARLAALRARRAALIADIADAPELRVAVREDGTPVVSPVGDAVWTPAATRRVPPLEPSEWPGFTAWADITPEHLAKTVDTDRMVFVNGRGPLLVGRDLKDVAFGILRAARRGSGVLEAVVGGVVFVPEGVGGVVFSSRVGLWAELGEVGFRVVSGVEVVGRGVVLDRGQGHAVRVGG
ncbi:hypothetical protein LO762_22930 [Actinocorallia sp. API 0066]|uniref:hypothetical protein n=1 Tax=Actinocorallia sp. API 0066 TaxID=2896846 RepID=UPI001E36556F|nr:hypothetical protein [Actinocorallia sp. API 0066]MCD0452023.1 hypothetical protein [Actinocorallia sp. API 0066]